MARIAIIGVGALGARHLQALTRLSAPLVIDLVDPSFEARNRAVSYLAGNDPLRSRIRSVSRVADLDHVPDIAIVATNARERLSSLCELCRLGCKRLILEKVLFTRHGSYKDAASAIELSDAMVWVNCARRSAPRFHRLVELLSGRPLKYQVEGFGWGLASNVIHHLDEWMFLTHGSALSLSGSFQPGVVPARRQGYLEVFGKICGSSGQSSFSAMCHAEAGSHPVGDRVVTLDCEGTKITIGQGSEELVIEREGYIIGREPYPVVMQSEATSWHVATILAGGEPPLPRFREAAVLHLALLDVLLPHFQSVDPGLAECPIT